MPMDRKGKSQGRKKQKKRRGSLGIRRPKFLSSPAFASVGPQTSHLYFLGHFVHLMARGRLEVWEAQQL